MPLGVSVRFTFVVATVAYTGALAQNDAGRSAVRVTVHDASGAVLPGAHGELLGPTASKKRTILADRNGVLDAAGLAAGRYMMLVSAPEFNVQRLSLSVGTGAVLTRDIVLTPGGFATSIDVVASSPTGSLDVPLSDVPVTVQTMSAQTLEDTNAIDLTEALNRRLNGVYINENQNNPFQPDVNYRGYTASPLVGAPAGLSVYLDGVRQNQPFGDVVQWDLIPKIAISGTELIPGSNPVYGLNTLGGAIAIQTKDGISNSGFTVSAYGGSFGRRAVDLQYGGSNSAGLNWFAAGTLFHEDGWRIDSPSSVKQSFAKLGYAHGNTLLSLSGGYSINNLTGNGTQDFRAIARTVGLNHGYNSVYSIPDVTYQHSPFLTLNVTQAFSSTLSLNLNSYVRYARANTTNGDINNDSFDQSLYALTAEDQAALTTAGIPFTVTAPNQANTPFPYLRCIAQALEMDEPGSTCTGIVTNTESRQHGYGVSGVLAWTTARNRLSIGTGWDHGTLSYEQRAQYGYLDGDGLTITAIPTFLDGTTSVDGVPQDTRVNLHGSTNTPSIFFTDTFNMGKWVLNAGGRYNHTNIHNVDRLPPVAYRGTLTAVNIFQRFNPTAGVVYKRSSRIIGYFDYGESSRAPTSTELGCADPNFPCSLPNALVSDPPLKQVVSRTFEGGVRGNPDGRYRWAAGYFHTDNNDDLLFVASQATGYGYFQNFGKTRREGVEASFAAHRRTVDAGAAYTFLNATYQSSQVIESDSNSSNSNALSGLRGVTNGGLITIVSGDHIPQVPQHLLKLYAGFHPLRKLSISTDLQLIGSAYVRGNENNLHQPDGVYYLGSGKSPEYGVVNLGSRYRFNSRYELFAEVNNLLNRHFYTAGQLASTPYDNRGSFVARPYPAYGSGGDTSYPVRNTTFLSPGAPITVFGGLRVSFGRR